MIPFKRQSGNHRHRRLARDQRPSRHLVANNAVIHLNEQVALVEANARAAMRTILQRRTKPLHHIRLATAGLVLQSHHEATGVNSLTRTLSVELAPKIRVNAVSPGPIPTEVFMEFYKLTEADLPALTERTGVPMKKLGEEEDIAAAVVYLCSPAAKWVTGEIINVTGGL